MHIHIHAFAAAVLAVDGKQMVQRERGREGEMWPEYGLINYGAQTATAALEGGRERTPRSLMMAKNMNSWLDTQTTMLAGVMSR